MKSFEILEEGLDVQSFDPETVSFEETVNSPIHQAEADARAAQEELRKASWELEQDDRRKQKERNITAQREKRHRDEARRTEKDAVRTSTAAFVSAVLAFLIYHSDIHWLAIAVACIAAILFGIACFQWGKYWEMIRVLFH